MDDEAQDVRAGVVADRVELPPVLKALSADPRPQHPAYRPAHHRYHL
jgi:hypothetical protein